MTEPATTSGGYGGSPRTWLREASDVAWRAAVVVGAVIGLGALLWLLRLVVLPVFVALLVCAALAPLVRLVEARGLPSWLATWLVLVGFLVVVVVVGTAIIGPTVAEADAIVDALTSGMEEVEEWLVTGPLGIERAQVESVTSDPGARISDLLRGRSERVIAGVRTFGEILTGAVLTMVLTFLFLKDGRRFQGWALDHLPARHHDVTRAAAARAWGALSGYLRGAAALGVVEGLAIGATLWAVGSPLYGPVAVFTFVAAFFPVVGAVVAGVLATLVALASGGFTDALIVAVVVVVIQQLDNDLLAPLIYGRSLNLHPAVILVVLTAGGVLGGIAGAFLAVPVTGGVFGVAGELWARHGRSWVEAGAEREKAEPGGDGTAGPDG